MRIHVGTSGYSYKEWKGIFYPEDLPAAKFLRFYAEHFDSVEINNTFYRMPDAKMLAKWAADVPEGFTFILKAPQRITHQKRLTDCGDDVRQLFEAASALEGKLGPILFQLPPFSRKDAGKLQAFVEGLPDGKRVAFEFRHASWFDEEVYDVLRSRDIALCAADTDETEEPEKIVVPTAGWGYLRLRRLEYSEEALRAWAGRIEAQSWPEAYVFFKHEDEARGPAFAKEFLAILGR
jgi:uncharacterized protein YecE (DUF72 family)